MVRGVGLGLSCRGGAEPDKSVRVAGHTRLVYCPYHFIEINHYDWLPRNTPDVLRLQLVNVR